LSQSLGIELMAAWRIRAIKQVPANDGFPPGTAIELASAALAPPADVSPGTGRPGIAGPRPVRYRPPRHRSPRRRRPWYCAPTRAPASSAPASPASVLVTMGIAGQGTPCRREPPELAAPASPVLVTIGIDCLALAALASSAVDRPGTTGPGTTASCFTRRRAAPTRPSGGAVPASLRSASRISGPPASPSALHPRK
jgi:hypothetical protein